MRTQPNNDGWLPANKRFSVLSRQAWQQFRDSSGTENLVGLGGKSEPRTWYRIRATTGTSSQSHHRSNAQLETTKTPQEQNARRFISKVSGTIRYDNYFSPLCEQSSVQIQFRENEQMCSFLCNPTPPPLVPLEFSKVFTKHFLVL